MRPRLRWVAVILLLAPHASAEDKAAAATLFDQGMALMEAKDYPAACAKLKDSVAASPGLGAMLWLGDCYEKNGQTASAWAQFRQAAALAAEKNDPREKVAHKRVADLEPKLSRLSIAVTAPAPALEVQRDGAPLSAASWGVAIPIDPGAHVITATAPGRVEYRKTITITNGGSEQLSIPALERVPEAPPRPVGTAGADAPTVADDPDRGNTQRIAGITVGAVGLLGIGLGTFFGLRASSKLDDSNADGRCQQPGDLCNAEGLALRSDASSAATVSTIMFATGAAALAGGIVLYFTAPRSKGGMSGVSVAPSAHTWGGAGAGLTITGTY